MSHRIENRLPYLLSPVLIVCALLVLWAAPVRAAGPGGLGLTDLSLWFKADAGVFSDSGCSTPAADGDAVACWTDQSNDGIHAVQNNAGQEPALAGSAINGLPAVAFSAATSDYLGTGALDSLTAPFPTTGAQVFAVVRNTALGSGQVHYVFSTVPYTDSNAFDLVMDPDNTAVNWDMGDASGATPPGRLGYSPFTDTTSFHLWSLAGESTSGQTIWLDGVQVAADTSGDSFVMNGQGMEIGRAGSSYFGALDGEVAELFIYNRPLSDLERTHVEIYLQNRYALELADMGIYDINGFGNQVRGISKSAAVSSSGSSGGLTLDDNGFLQENDDVIVVGHNNAAWDEGVTANLASNPLAKERWARIWAVKLNDDGANGGSVRVTFDRIEAGGGGTFDQDAAYYLLARAAGSSDDFQVLPVDGTTVTSTQVTFTVPVQPMEVEFTLGRMVCPAAGTTTLYVDHAATGTGDGQSWANAFTSLQDALETARVCRTTSGITTINVAQGIYHPDDGAAIPVGDTDRSFELIDGITVSGGWDAASGNQDIAAYRTVLSGDLADDDPVDAHGVLNDPTAIVGSNATHVVTSMGNPTNTQITGVTITAGDAGAAHGAGMYLDMSNVKVNQVIFRGNRAASGSGGGLAVTGTSASTPELSDLTIENNLADTGGGLAVLDSGSAPLITGAAIGGNQALTAGGGVALITADPATTLNFSQIYSNTAATGGGIHVSGFSPTMENLVISGNTASGNGAGLSCDGASPTLTTTTITGNRAAGSGGGLYNADANTVVKSVIIHNNADASGTGTAAASASNSGTSDPLFTHSLIQGSGGSSAWVPAVGTDGGNNIDADPDFAAPLAPSTAPSAAGDFHLQTHSPAIDTGNNGDTALTEDIEGNVRQLDGDADATVTMDMGAYEAPTHYRLTVTKSGNGVGLVTSDPPGIDFGPTQSEIWPENSAVTLVAAPDPHSLLTAWNGDCVVDPADANKCVATLDASKTVDAQFDLETNTITATVDGTGGAIDPAGDVAVPHGSTQTFDFTPDTGYHVAEVLVDGAAVTPTPASTYTFSNVTAPHTISVRFAIDTFTITASAGAGGTIAPDGSVTVNYGADQDFTITPNTGYHITDVLVDGVSQGAITAYTFTAVDADHTIEARFAINEYTITPSVDPAGTGAGTISPDTPVTVAHGGGQTFTFTPADSSTVSKVTVNGTEILPTPTVSHTVANVTADTTIQVTFALRQFTVTPGAGPNGTITPNTPETVDYGADSSAYTMTPATGYHIEDITVNGVSVGTTSPHTIANVTEDKSIYVTFAPDIKQITTSVASGVGTISPDGSTTAVEVPYGSSQRFDFLPRTGYHVGDVRIDGTSVGAPSSYTFTNVDADHQVEVDFAIDTFTIQASSGTGGSVSDEGATTVDYGSSKTYTITPETGYEIADVLVDGVSQGAVSSYDFTDITANHAIHATFAIKHYTIAASAGTGGSITPAGDVDATHGSSRTFAFTPDTGYHVADVLVDGASVGARSSYTFTNITADHAIAVSFALDTFTISASSGPGGVITPAGSSTVEYGGRLLYTITPDTGYEVDDVLVNGVSVGAVTSHEFTNVTANQTISASFKLQVLTIEISSEGEGTVSPTGQTAVNYGDSLLVTFSPTTPGYHVEDVLVDGNSIGAPPSYNFANVTGDHSLHVVFAPDLFTINAAAGSNGSITPAGAVIAAFHTEPAFTITAAKGFYIDDVLLDGTSIFPGGDMETWSYTFDPVEADHDLVATFRDSGYRYISVTLTGNGTVTPAGAEQRVEKFSNISFTFTPQSPWFLESMTVDGQAVDPAVNPYTFTRVEENHTISVVFGYNFNWAMFLPAIQHGHLPGSADQPVGTGEEPAPRAEGGEQP